MPKVDVKIVHLGIKDMKLLAPHPEACQECAEKHDPRRPHNQQSIYYQYKFYQEHDRWPTWADAMAHCTPEVKQAWIEALRENGVEVSE